MLLKVGQEIVRKQKDSIVIVNRTHRHSIGEITKNSNVKTNKKAIREIDRTSLLHILGLILVYVSATQSIKLEAEF